MIDMIDMIEIDMTDMTDTIDMIEETEDLDLMKEEKKTLKEDVDHTAVRLHPLQIRQTKNIENTESIENLDQILVLNHQKDLQYLKSIF